LNGQVTYDGNSSCNISFGWGLVSNPANWALYTVHTDVAGLFYTGNFTSLSLTSLNASATYYYNVRIQNPYGTAYGIEGSFTTESGIGEPSNFIAISNSNSVSLIWVKGVGSTHTLVRKSTGTYPNGIGIGDYVVLNTGGSYLLAGLTPGTTYYLSAWGNAGGFYSTNYTTVMVTTLAYSSVNTTSNTTATPNNSWIQTSNETNIAHLPVLPMVVTWVADVYNQPVNYLWYFLWIMAGVAFGIVTYKISYGKFFVAFIIESLWFALGAAVGLVMLWILVAFFIIGAGMSFFGDRR